MNTFLTKKAKSVKGRLKRYIIITIGAFFYAAAISLFLDPNKIAPGGVMGISILISHFCNIQSGTINMVLNIPIMLLGLKKFGWRFMCSTVYSVFMISIFTNILSIHGALTDDLLIAGVVGGILLGISLAITFKSGATTGGVDIIIKVLRLKWRHIKTNIFFLLSDSMVIFAAWLIYQNMTVAFYAGIAVFVNSIVIPLLDSRLLSNETPKSSVLNILDKNTLSISTPSITYDALAYSVYSVSGIKSAQDNVT